MCGSQAVRDDNENVITLSFIDQFPNFKHFSSYLIN